MKIIMLSILLTLAAFLIGGLLGNFIADKLKRYV